MTSFQSLLQDQVLLPIIQADSEEQGIAIAKAMQQGGIHLVEVVLRTEQSLAALKAIKAAFPEMVVGAGTVTSEETLQGAIDAGADFIVTPGTSPKLLEKLATCGVPVVPGVASASDIILVGEYGFKEVKLFPASIAGGAPMIKAMGAVFPDVTICPTGGVSASNKDDFLKLKNCVAVGGTWVAAAEWVQNEDWDAIADACREANKKPA